VDPEKV
jgi:hypothetical protein